jgi:hypothetical protein
MLVYPKKHKNPKKRILIKLLGAVTGRPLTLTEQIIGTKYCIDVAFIPPSIPRTADMLGNTIATKVVNMMKIPVSTKFSFYEKLSRPKKM